MSEVVIQRMVSSPAIMSNVSEAVNLISRNGVIRFATPMAAHVVGYSVEQVRGRSVLRYIAPEVRDEVIHGWETFRDDPDTSYAEISVPLVGQDGKRTHVRSSIWRLDRDQFLMIYHVMDAVRDRLDTLYAVTTAAAGTLELNQVMDIVLQEAERLISSERSKLFILDESGTVTLVHALADGDRDYTPEALEQFSTFTTLRHIYQSGQSLIINDTLADERWIMRQQRTPVRSWMGVPLVINGRVIGVLSLQSTRADNFSEDDAELAQMMASQVASMIHNARLYRAERERVQRYQVLNDISQAISFLDLHSVLDIVYFKLREMMDTTTFFIGLYDSEAATITLAGSYEDGRKVADQTFPANIGMVGEIVRTCESVIIHDTLLESLPGVAIVQGDMPRSLIMLPLLAQEQLVGVLSVQSYRPHAYSEDDIALLETIAGAVATAVRNARLHDQTVERLTALETLHQTGLQISASEDISAIAAQTIESALTLFSPMQIRLCLWGEWPNAPTLTWSAHPVFNREGLRIREEADYMPHRLMERVHADGQMLVIADLNEEPVLQAEFATSWLVQGLVITPLKHGDRQIGAIQLLYGEPQFFRRDALRTLELLCLQAAGALENARQTVTLRRRLEEVSALQDLGRRVSSAEDLDELLATVVQKLHETYRCRSVSVAMLDPADNMVITCAAAGLEDSVIEEARFAFGEPVAGQVVATGEAVYVADTTIEPGFRFVDPAVRCLMSVPLTVHNRTIGVLSIDSEQPHAFTPDHERVLSIAGGQIAAAIENVRLLAETRERAEQLTQANADLKAIDEVRRDLVNQVSHDLRSPLSIVYGYAGLLRDGEVGTLTTEQRDLLDLVLQRTQAIERMTIDILSTKQISRDVLELDLIDISQMCQQTLTDSRMVHGARGMIFEAELTEGPFIVQGDFNRLNRVFDNLIGNAVKFSPDGGTITLKTSYHADSNEIWIAISDQGIGIAPDKLPYVFERFFQGDLAIKKRFGGTGLGLYIVKLIVEAHYGRVWVESCEGCGSTFTFALPLAGLEAPGPAETT